MNKKIKPYTEDEIILDGDLDWDRIEATLDEIIEEEKAKETTKQNPT